LKAVDVLRIIGTNATSEGLKRLQESLPNCRIEV
jgi:hypothetical protein